MSVRRNYSCTENLEIVEARVRGLEGIVTGKISDGHVTDGLILDLSSNDSPVKQLIVPVVSVWPGLAIKAFISTVKGEYFADGSLHTSNVGHLTREQLSVREKAFKLEVQYPGGIATYKFLPQI